jgi:hypothetical protein
MSEHTKAETVDIDTGTIAEVPADQRIDVDEGDGANALVGGDDSDAAAGAFRNPGEIPVGNR